MTREQLIREMIQIELLYQTRQKLLKENGKNNNNPANSHLIGDNTTNEFIKSLKNEKILLKNEYTKNKTALTITQLEYPKDKGHTRVAALNEEDITIIWNYLENKLHEKLEIPKAALGKIVDILKAADRKLNDKVFSVFNTEFPLQSLDFDSGLKNIADTINAQIKINNPLYIEIFKNKSKDENQTFNSGKGEFLTVLLVKDAKSGGTKKLDVVVNDKQFDVKQISQHSVAAAKLSKAAKNQSTSTATETVQQLLTQAEEEKLLPANYLALTLSEKSGLRNPKNKFVNAQAKLGQKLSQLTSELEKLNVEDKLINKLKTQEGYTSSAFRRSSTDSDEDPNKYLSFADMSDIIKQGLIGLSANTYVNIKQLKDFKTNEFITRNSIVSGPNTPNETIVNFFKNYYNIQLKNFNEIKEGEIDNKLLINQMNDDVTKLLFKKFNVAEYNRLIDNNIDTEYVNYFKINGNYFPVFNLTAQTNINAKEFDVFKRNFENLPEFNSFFNNNQTAADFKKNYGTGKNDPANDTNTFRTKVYKVLNNQVFLSESQMKKINKIIRKNDEIKLNKDSIRGINNNTVIGDNYFVAEPLKSTQNKGEFIIDISYYENMKKRHVDTLYSQDFKIDKTKNKGNSLEKTNKAATIKNIANNKTRMIPNITIDLENVISDRDTINNKLKNFQLFDNLQPSILKDLFNKNKNKNNLPNTNTTDFLSDKDIQNNLKDIKDKTKEDNILNIIYEMYVCCDQIEKEIKEYYIKQNSILIYKDDGSSQGGTSTPRAAYTWESVINNLESKSIDSFIMQIGHEQILCYSDNNVPENLDNNTFNSVKNLIKKLFNEVMKLMLDLQSITPRK